MVFLFFLSSFTLRRRRAAETCATDDPFHSEHNDLSERIVEPFSCRSRSTTTFSFNDKKSYQIISRRTTMINAGALQAFVTTLFFSNQRRRFDI